MDDEQLLREYVASHSETAFRALVERYVPLVYGAALRQLDNSSQAEDVTQAVFIILARKAAVLPKKTILSGWLYRATRFTADKAKRAEFRRQQREREAVQMQTIAADHDWSRFAPILDEAMAQLQQGDRTAILLRFFENKSLKDVGRAMGISEDTAQKRVSRAIEKLRALFVKQGVAVSATAMTTAISAHATPVVSAQLSATVAATGVGHQAASAGIQSLVQQTSMALHRWFVPKIIATSVAVLVFLAAVFMVWYHYSSKQSAPGPTAGFTPGAASIVVRVPGVPPAPAVPGVATLRIDLTGTSGLRFDVLYSDGAQTRTVSGVLPNEVSFQADAFTASIILHDPGQFGFQIYRNDRLTASGGPTIVTTTNHTISVRGLARGQGIHFSVTK